MATHVLMVWPGLTEMIGRTGIFDYVEFLGEYGPYDLYDLENFARAAELGALSTMIKVDQEPRTYLAERALSAGIQNVLFADIRTVRDAEEAVRAVRPEPKGIMGNRFDRRRGYMAGSPNDLVEFCENVVVALMIEKKSAVENLEAILSVKGIDMIQFGPMDYSQSLGLAGQTSHPKVREAELKTIKTALKLGLSPRAEINSPDEAKKYLDLGVRHFSIGLDLRIIYDWLKTNGGALRDLLSTK